MNINLGTKNYLGISLIGLAVIAFWVFGTATWDRVSLLKAAVAERQDILSSRKEILLKIENLNKQYKEKSSDVNKISSVIPSTKSPAELVSTLEAMSQQSGLQLTEIAMSDSSKQKIQEELQTISIEIALTGSYSSLTNFLNLLEKNVRLLDIFEMSASETSSTGSQIALNIRIKANAYYLNLNLK